jgi:hypothetical protein
VNDYQSARWCVEVFLQDGTGRSARVSDAEFADRHTSTLWITAELESLRWNGQRLGQDEAFCYVAKLTESQHGPIASAYLFDRSEPVEWRRDPPAETLPSDERICRCGLPLSPPPGLRVWRPMIDLAPRLDERVSSVVIYRMDPLWMRAVRVPSGWLRCGRSIPPWRVPWPHVGLCAAGVSHPVVGTSDPAVRTW